MPHRRSVLLAPLLLAGWLLLGCAPGNVRWQGGNPPANFWAGIWHGMIITVTFVVSLFTREVGIYEAHNVGWGYDLGFIFGCMISLGGGIRATARRRRPAVDWSQIEHRISKGIREGLRSQRAPDASAEPNWDELGRQVEERVREELHKAGLRR